MSKSKQGAIMPWLRIILSVEIWDSSYEENNLILQLFKTQLTSAYMEKKGMKQFWMGEGTFQKKKWKENLHLAVEWHTVLEWYRPTKGGKQFLLKNQSRTATQLREKDISTSQEARVELENREAKTEAANDISQIQSDPSWPSLNPRYDLVLGSL